MIMNLLDWIVSMDGRLDAILIAINDWSVFDEWDCVERGIDYHQWEVIVIHIGTNVRSENKMEWEWVPKVLVVCRDALSTNSWNVEKYLKNENEK